MTATGLAFVLASPDRGRFRLPGTHLQDVMITRHQLNTTREIIRKCCSRAYSQKAPWLASLIPARITRDQRDNWLGSAHVRRGLCAEPPKSNSVFAVVLDFGFVHLASNEGGATSLWQRRRGKRGANSVTAEPQPTTTPSRNRGPAPRQARSAQSKLQFSDLTPPPPHTLIPVTIEGHKGT
jgi:hypothetical protein